MRTMGAGSISAGTLACAGAGILPRFALRGVVHARAVKSSRRRFASLTPALRIDGPRMHHTSHGKFVKRARAGSGSLRGRVGRGGFVEVTTGLPAVSSTLPGNYSGLGCRRGAVFGFLWGRLGWVCCSGVDMWGGSGFAAATVKFRWAFPDED